MIFMFAKINDGVVERYPYSMNDLRQDNPNVSFPMDMSDGDLLAYGVVRVNVRPRPEAASNEKVVEDVPIQLDGVWWQVYRTETLSAEELDAYSDQLARQLRERRNALLLESDWTQLADAPLSQERKLSWVAYRQALRDMTDMEGFPLKHIFPAAPS